jgi:hypothetical protein
MGRRIEVGWYHLQHSQLQLQLQPVVSPQFLRVWPARRGMVLDGYMQCLKASY